MMTFFSSLFLWSLVGLAIPLAIALWNRRRKKRIKFAGFFLLRKLSQTTEKRRRLTDILRWLNRFAIFIFFILVFAEPYYEVQRRGDAGDGFAILLDVSRDMQRKTSSGQLLGDAQNEALQKLLAEIPSQSRGMIFLVSDRCESAFVDADSSLTATSQEWQRRLRQQPPAFQNARLQPQALTQCLSRIRSLFQETNLLKVLISPLPDSIRDFELSAAGFEVISLDRPSDTTSSSFNFEMSRDQPGLVRILFQGDPIVKIERWIDGQIEPLVISGNEISLSSDMPGFLLVHQKEAPDAWASLHVVPLRADLVKDVTLWAARESPGFLSLATALRHHPRLRVTRQVGGIPQGDAIVFYGEPPQGSQSPQQSLIFLQPEGVSQLPVRDQKILSSQSASPDLLRAFRLATPQGPILIRRYLLLDADRFETLRSFEDGAPALLNDGLADRGRMWVVPFDLEDLTTEVTLEPTFVPFLYSMISEWIEADTEIMDEVWEAVWSYPGYAGPSPRILGEKRWPGMYRSQNEWQVVPPLAPANHFLEAPQSSSNSTEEKVTEQISWRKQLLLLLALCASIEIIWGVASAWVVRHALGLLAVTVLLSTNLSAERLIPLAMSPESDRERVRSLEQLSTDAERMTNLFIAPPSSALPRDYWKFPLIVISSTQAWGPWNEADRSRIRDYLERGGLLFFDDPLASVDTTFYRSVRKELEAIFPGRSLTRVPREDVIFRTFYLLDEVSGRRLAQPYLEGMLFDQRWVALFSSNDLLGAILRSPRGDYQLSVTPYGLSQRQLSQRLLLNVLMYAATSNYKDDAIHLPHILKRRVR
jgi:hypothetical protein